MKPIFITSAERSGSPIIATIIANCGVFTGRTSKMLENLSIRNLMRMLYEDMKVDPNGQYPLPDIDNLRIPVLFRKNIIKVLEKDGFRGDGVWLFNSGYLAQTWPVWVHSFPEAQWVIVRRKPTDIVQSCIKTDYMNAFSDPDICAKVGAANAADGWKWWIEQHNQRFIEMINEGLDIKVVWPQRMVHGDYEQVYQMLRWLGLKWKSDVFTQVDTMLHKSRMKEKCEK